ncbi:MAG: putative quinol monooxygenase [Pirellulales bacterium]|nr:putative quinol monooxygenase [Pirellulales bacterium]
MRSWLLALGLLGCGCWLVTNGLTAKEDQPAPGLPEQLAKLGLADKTFTLIVEVKVKPESIKKMEALMVKAATNTHKEPGCEMYDIHRDPANPGTYYFLERFQGVKGLQAHLDTDYTKELLAAFGSEAASPPQIKIIEQFSPAKK